MMQEEMLDLYTFYRELNWDVGTESQTDVLLFFH